MSCEDDAYKKNYKRLEELAKKRGYIFNPNKDWVDQVVRLMTNNFIELGKYFCPCKQHYPIDVENDISCPCPELSGEVAEDGHCHCRLFYKPGTEKEKMNILETITCPG